MKSITKEWLALAEADFASALRESRVTENPSPSTVVFHAQQCLEKLLKAILVELGVECPWTHDRLILNDAVQAALGAPWTVNEDDLRTLLPGAVQYRYPGDIPTMTVARQPMSACERARSAIQIRLERL